MNSHEPFYHSPCTWVTAVAYVYASFPRVWVLSVRVVLLLGVCLCQYVNVCTHWLCWHFRLDHTISTRIEWRPSKVKIRPVTPTWSKVTRTPTSYQEMIREIEHLGSLEREFKQNWGITHWNGSKRSHWIKPLGILVTLFYSRAQTVWVMPHYLSR